MPADIRVVAIIAAYNEADIIEQVVGDLIAQGVHVYFLDDGSTDGTVGAVERCLDRGLLGIERVGDARPDASRGRFEWERLLLRKAELARELDAAWFIHHDADEFRESPWTQLTLLDAIRRVDALGYNAVDFASFDFWPVHDDFRPGDDVREAFSYYAERAPYDRLQIRCWKKTDAVVDLASTGGHEARFEGRRVFPLRFVSRHYPIRGQAHGERKVFAERRGRFLDAERARGWHVQYEGYAAQESFIRDPSTLTRYDADAVRLSLTLRHRGVEALEESLAATRSEVDGLRTSVDARTRELAHCARALEEHARVLDATARELAAVARERRRCAEEFARAETAMAAAAAEAAALRAELERKARDIAMLEGHLDAQADEIARWRRAVEDLSGRLDAVERSLSWRLTAPARAALRLLTGR